MGQGKLARMGTTVAVWVAIVAAVFLLKVFLDHGPGAAAPATISVTPAPTIAPLSTTPSNIATPTAQTAQSAISTPTPSNSPAATPRPGPVVPEVAPDFTLQGAKGVEITLSEQLAQGPVALVFFKRGGG